MKRKLDSARTASARPLLAVRNAVSISPGARTSRYRCCTPNAPAASSVSLNTCALPGSVEFPRTATRESLGTISFRSSSCFPLISGASVDNPVMFPPGRARLATNPFPTGSKSNAMTIGIVTVASLAARVDCGPAETMMSTLRRTNSAASARRRSIFSSAYRSSTTVFFPSTYPSSRRPWRNASRRAEITEGEEAVRNPIRGIFVGCCASTTAPHIANATPRATIPTNFRFWILRRGSGHALDFQLSEQEFKNRFSVVLCMCFRQSKTCGERSRTIGNRKSKII